MLCGLCLCLLWGDVADGGVNPDTIVIALDISEQVAPCSIAIGVFAMVDELGFQCAKEALHWRIVPAVCLAAHRLDDRGGLQDVAVVAGGVTGCRGQNDGSGPPPDAAVGLPW